MYWNLGGYHFAQITKIFGVKFEVWIGIKTISQLVIITLIDLSSLYNAQLYTVNKILDKISKSQI